MSGRDKRTPASPEEEREQLRALTRELHEAAKDARAAARELRDARASVTATAEDYLMATVQDRVAEINRQINDEADRLFDSITDIGEKIEEKHAQLLGFADAGQLLEWLAARIVAQLNEPAFLDKVARRVQTGKRLKVDRRPRPAGEVLVMTPESLREFTAAGGDPGIIIDAR